MKLKYIVKTSLKSLETNKTRSFLTILGIVIGVAAIILIVSIGAGAENLIISQLQGLGADVIVIRPGREPKGPVDIAETILGNSLKNRDVEALKKKENVPDISGIAPGVFVPGSVSYEGETYRPMVFGWSAEFLGTMFNIGIREGTLFGDSEIAQRQSVAVIGSKVATELFGNSSALGKYITIRDRKFKIVGVTEPSGQVVFFDVNEVVVIPYSTAQKYLLGIDYYNEILIQASSAEAVPRTIKDIELTLREMHNITDPDKDDFYIVTQQAAVEQIGTILNVLTLFLSSIVAISLVVGGIGVMNIMLVSVTERTREIGLRKALGATNGNILKQFLLEAIMLTAAGGIAGILIGMAFSGIFSLVLSRVLDLNWEFSFSITAAALGFSVATGVGLIFGLYPARKASLKSPMEALRYE